MNRVDNANDVELVRTHQPRSGMGTGKPASIDGKPLKITLDENTSVRYNVQPQITKYLKELGKCQEEPYYDCISSQIDNTEFKECPKKCIPDVFSIMDKNYSTPFC